MVARRAVWVEDLDCCGEPFDVGTTVSWPLHSIDEPEHRFLVAVFGSDIADRMTDGYERHGGGPPRQTRSITGVVRSIVATSWRVHPLGDDTPETDALGLYAEPGSIVLQDQTSARAFDEVGGRSCFGYIVDLDVVDGA